MKEIIFAQYGDRIYTINEEGQIFNKKTGKILKMQINPKGYSQLSISGDTYRPHRLVALAFIPNPLGLPMVNHINGDKSNNKVCNLEWCTAKQNTRNAIDRGVHNIPMYINGYKIIKNMQQNYSNEEISLITGVVIEKILLCK